MTKAPTPDYDNMTASDRAYALFTACEVARSKVDPVTGEKGGHNAALKVWNAWALPLVAERERLIAAGEWEIGKEYDSAFGGLIEFGKNDLTYSFFKRSVINASFFSFVEFCEVEHIENQNKNIVGNSGAKTICCDAINFSEFHFPGDALFRCAKFTGDIYFNKAIFNGYVWFSKAKFIGDVHFSGTIFNKLTVFSNTNFNMAANFDVVIFNDKVEFENTIIESYASFENAIFNSILEFSECEIKGNAGFGSVKFNGEAYFECSLFYRSALFDKAEFNQRVWFVGAIFDGDAWFVNTTFQNEADFHDTVFNDDALFNGTKFISQVEFENATIKGNAKFNNTEFNGDVWFNSTKVIGKAQFDGANFKGFTSFDNVVFCGDTVFSTTDWNDTTTFENTSFFAASNFTAIHSKRAFNLDNTIFHTQIPQFTQAHFSESPRLDNLKLPLPERRSKFMPQIDFDHLVERGWKMHGYNHETRTGRFMVDYSKPGRLEKYYRPNEVVVDKHWQIAPTRNSERILRLRPYLPPERPPAKHITQDDIAAYTAIRKMALLAQDHETERMAFKGEMRARRALSDSWLYRSASWVYDKVFNFGWSFKWPSLILLGMFVLAAILYFAAASPQRSASACGDTHNFNHALLLSGHNALLFATAGQSKFVERAYVCLYANGADDLKKTSLSPWFGILGAAHTLFSAVLIFFILLALRNRFKIK